MSSWPPSAALVVEQTENYAEVMKYANPKITKEWGECSVCQAAKEWFAYQGKRKPKAGGGDGAERKGDDDDDGQEEEGPDPDDCDHRIMIDNRYVLPLGRTATSARKMLNTVFNHVVRVFPYWHQYRILKQFEGLDWTRPFGLGLILEMGSGKTYLSLAFAILHFASDIDIICDNTALNHWVRYAKMMNQLGAKCKIRIFGYTEFGKQIADDLSLVRKHVVIVDECQRFKNLTENAEFILQRLGQAQCILALTGTPFEGNNILREAKALCCLLNPDQPKLISQPDEYFSPSQFAKLVHGRVAYYNPELECGFGTVTNFPKKIHHEVRVPMSYFQYLIYLLSIESTTKIGPYVIQRSIRNSYDSLLRRVSNCIPPDELKLAKEEIPELSERSPKAWAMIQQIRKFGLYPQATYSHYRDLGNDQIVEQLDEDEAQPVLRFENITGATKGEDRQKFVDMANARKLDVLNLTDVGQTNINLVTTHAIHLMEPPQSFLANRQIEARCCRQNSIPREVHIFRYISTAPDWSQKPSKGDKQRLARYIQDKLGFKMETPEAFIGYMKARAMELGQTVDEKIYHRNEQNHLNCAPYMDAIVKDAAASRASLAGPRRRLAAHNPRRRGSVSTSGGAAAASK